MKNYLYALLLGTALTTPAQADPVYNVPFEDLFDENTKRDYYTTLDVNQDGVTFQKHFKTSIFPGFYPDTDFHEMEYDSGAAHQKADDWFISPKIHLEAGKVYSFSFNGYVSFDSFTHVLEVLMGQGVTVESMTMRVLPQTTLSESSSRLWEQEFTVDKDGDYNFGFHVTSEADHGSLYFTNIRIRQASNDLAPARISDLRVTPDTEGKLQANLSFTAPQTSISGQPLKSITQVEVLRDGTLIQTLKDIQPGQAVRYEDHGPHNGYNSYTLIPYNEQGKGIRTHIDSVYVGVDRPLPPTGFTLTDGGDRILIRWNKVSQKGTHGMYVNPDEVVYIAEALNSSYGTLLELARTRDTQLEYAFNTQEGQQDLKRFGVRASNTAGWSDFAYGRMVIGTPYNLPYRESFATGASHGLNWQEGDGTYYVTTQESADADAGCVQFVPNKDGEQVSFNLGKMNMRQTSHPVMRFAYKGLGREDRIAVVAVRQDGTEVALGTLEGETTNWTTITLDLQALVGEPYIIPKFRTTGTRGQAICLDDIQLLDLYDCDLSLTLEAETDDSNLVRTEVTLSNEGLAAVNEYEVVLFAEGKEVRRINVNEKLLPGQRNVLKETFPLEATDKESVEIAAQLVCLFDLNPSNDQANVQVAVNKTPLGTGDETAIRSLGTGKADATLATGKANMDIHSLDGRRLGKGEATRRALKKGIYIIEGKKICTK